MSKRFKIDKVVENGQAHWVVFDYKTGKETHCDLDELKETLWELMGV